MRTKAQEAQIIDTVCPLLLFIPTMEGMDCACRQAGEFLAFCRNRHSGSFANGRLLGAWVDKRAVTEFPQEMTMRLPTDELIVLAVQETFSLWGDWTIASIAPAHQETMAGAKLHPDGVIDALFAAAQGDADLVGRYSPVFACGTPKEAVRAEIERLNIRYPLRIERSIYYDPVTGGLSLGEE
ncbi:MAG: hypothetical protein ACYDEV_13620 [Acidiferrobacter sp.]